MNFVSLKNMFRVLIFIFRMKCRSLFRFAYFSVRTENIYRLYRYYLLDLFWGSNKCSNSIRKILLYNVNFLTLTSGIPETTSLHAQYQRPASPAIFILRISLFAQEFWEIFHSPQSLLKLVREPTNYHQSDAMWENFWCQWPLRVRRWSKRTSDTVKRTTQTARFPHGIQLVNVRCQILRFAVDAGKLFLAPLLLSSDKKMHREITHNDRLTWWEYVHGTGYAASGINPGEFYELKSKRSRRLPPVLLIPDHTVVPRTSEYCVMRVFQICFGTSAKVDAYW